MEEDYQSQNVNAPASDVNSTSNSDSPTQLVYVPSKMGIIWYTMNGAQIIQRIPANNQTSINVDVEITDTDHTVHKRGVITRRFRRPTGAFFQYVSSIPIDLSTLQIFCDVHPEYYQHNCFVYACIQSGLFTKLEIDQPCRIINQFQFARSTI